MSEQSEHVDAAQPSRRRRAGTAVRTTPHAAPPRVDRLPMFRVLLHNDAINSMLYVVDALTELTPLNRQRATAVMLEAHTRGLALVLTTHQERAELYRDQFKSKKLTVTIEPLE